MKLSTTFKNFGSIAHKLRSARVFLFLEKFFRILDPLGLNLNAINLKFSQIVGHEAVYNI